MNSELIEIFPRIILNLANLIGIPAKNDLRK